MARYLGIIRHTLGSRLVAMRSDERGAITTETAVVTLMLIGVALTVIAAIGIYAGNVVTSFDPMP